MRKQVRLKKKSNFMYSFVCATTLLLDSFAARRFILLSSCAFAMAFFVATVATFCLVEVDGLSGCLAYWEVGLQIVFRNLATTLGFATGGGGTLN